MKQTRENRLWVAATFLTMIVLLAATLCAATLYAARSHIRSFTAQTATGTTAVLDFRSVKMHPDKLTVQLNVTGSPTGCAYQLEGSLDNVNFFDLSGSQTCTANKMFHLDAKYVRYLRGNLTTLTGGTSPSVTLLIGGVSR